MPTLLGHLAQFAALNTQAEVLCTQGLAYLLRNPRTGAAFAALVAERTGSATHSELSWRAEVYQAVDGARPDLEACGPDGLPCIKVEAKLDALLLPAQLYAYAADLQQRSGGGTLIVLVPRRRKHEVIRIIESAFGASEPGPWRPADYPGVVVAVIEWEEVLRALRADASERVVYEVEALEEMYLALAGHPIAPLAGTDDLYRWREREGDMVRLVDAATRRLSGGDRLLPLRSEPTDAGTSHASPQPVDYRLRYMCRPLGAEQPCFSVGVRDPFEGHDTPIWLRFHARTPCFALIRERIMASPLASKTVASGRHLWLPLDVPLHAEEDVMVGALVDQAEEVAAVAYARRVIPRAE